MSLSYLRATVQFHQSKQQIKIALCIVMKIPELLVAMSHISGTSLKALTCLMTKIYQNAVYKIYDDLSVYRHCVTIMGARR